MVAARGTFRILLTPINALAGINVDKAVEHVVQENDEMFFETIKQVWERVLETLVVLDQ